MAFGVEDTQRRNIRMQAERDSQAYMRKIGAKPPPGYVSKNQMAADVQAQKDAGLSVNVDHFAGQANPGTVAAFQEDAAKYNTRLAGPGGIRSAILGSDKGDSKTKTGATQPLMSDAAQRATKGLDLLGRQNDLRKQMFGQDLLADSNSASSQLQRMYQSNLSTPMGIQTPDSRDSGISSASTYSATGLTAGGGGARPLSTSSFKPVNYAAGDTSFGDNQGYATGGRIPAPDGQYLPSGQQSKDYKDVKVGAGEAVMPGQSVAALEQKMGMPVEKFIEQTTGRKPRSLRNAKDGVLYARDGAVDDRRLLTGGGFGGETGFSTGGGFGGEPRPEPPLPATVTRGGQPPGPQPQFGGLRADPTGMQVPQDPTAGVDPIEALTLENSASRSPSNSANRLLAEAPGRRAAIAAAAQTAQQPRAEQVDRFTVGGDNDVYRQYDASGRVTGYRQSPDGNFGGTSIRRAQDEQRAYSQLAGQSPAGFMDHQGYREGLANLPQVRNRTWYNSDAEWNAAKEERQLAQQGLTDQYKPLVSQRLNAQAADEAFTRQQMLAQAGTQGQLAIRQLELDAAKQATQQALAVEEARYKRENPTAHLRNAVEGAEWKYRADNIDDEIATRAQQAALPDTQDLLSEFGAGATEQKNLAPKLVRNDAYMDAVKKGRTDDARRIAASMFLSEFAYDKDWSLKDLLWNQYPEVYPGDLSPQPNLLDEGVTKNSWLSRVLGMTTGGNYRGDYQIRRGDDEEAYSVDASKVPAGLRAYLEETAKNAGSERRLRDANSTP